MQPKGLVALRYMTQFRCTGGDCIDTCCQGWHVFVDEPHYVQLRRKLAVAPESLVDFDAKVPLLPAERRTQGRFATLRIDDDQSCAFLDAERLCSLHRAYGHEILPDICTQYPRVVNVVGERAELAGSLSCPEVAQLLLFDESSTDLVEVGADLLGPRRRQLPASATRGASAAMVDELQRALYRLTSSGRHAAKSRLFFLAAAALRTKAVLERPRVDLAALGDLLGELESPVALAMMDECCNGMLTGNAFALETVIRAASLRGGGVRHARYDAFMSSIVETLHARGEGAVAMELDALGGKPSFTIDAERLFPVHVARNAALRARFGPLLDRAARGFLRHSLTSQAPLVAAKDFATFLLSLVARVAMQQLFTVFHPRVDDALGSGDEASMKELLREGYYVVARALEHNKTLGAALQSTVRERVRSLPEAAAIIALT